MEGKPEPFAMAKTTQPLPSLDDGCWHPCQHDGVLFLPHETRPVIPAGMPETSVHGGQTRTFYDGQNNPTLAFPGRWMLAYLPT